MDKKMTSKHVTQQIENAKNKIKSLKKELQTRLKAEREQKKREQLKKTPELIEILKNNGVEVSHYTGSVSHKEDRPWEAWSGRWYSDSICKYKTKKVTYSPERYQFEIKRGVRTSTYRCFDNTTTSYGRYNYTRRFSASDLEKVQNYLSFAMLSCLARKSDEIKKRLRTK